jgi:hypothetical protein
MCAQTYPISQLLNEMLMAVAATREIKIAEARSDFSRQCQPEESTFIPYIVAEGEHRVPASICLYGVTGGKWNVIELPESILALSLEDQLLALPDLMRTYRIQHDGHVPFFGELTGFKFVRVLDHFQFDKSGVFMGRVDEPFRKGFVEVLIG